MSIQFSGLSSGLPVEDIIAKLMAIEQRSVDLLKARKNKINSEKSQYSTISSRASSLRSSLTKLTDSNLGAMFDLFKAKTTSSSDSTKVTASATNEAQSGSFTVDVTQLASATKAKSLSTVGMWTTGGSTIDAAAEDTITTGKFTVYVSGQAQLVDVDEGATIQTIIDRVAIAITNVDPGAMPVAEVTADGKIKFTGLNGNIIRFGATGDTSNFAELTHLTTGSENVGNTEFTAKYGTSTIDKQGLLVGNTANLKTEITAGTFTLGGATFTVDATTTLENLLSNINSSQTADVSVSYNTATNDFEIISRETGNQYITLGNPSDTSNFLTAMNLVTGGGDSTQSQTLGNNAKFKINGGVELESATNSASSSVTGMMGVTLNLLSPTTSAVTVDVKQDTDQIKTAVSDFVSKFNSLISYIADQTKKDAVLNGESALIRFRNELRTEISGSAADALGLTKYSILSQIGISTGAVNASPGQGTPSATFIFTESTFLSALADNPDEVKKLLVGDGTTGGVLNVLEETIEGSLDSEFGIFSSRDKSANDTIKNINDAIERGEERLEAKEKLLRKQFSAMEKLITQLNQQQSALLSLNSALTLNKK